MLSSTLVGLMVGYLLVSPLAARFGHKRVILWSTCLFGIFTLLAVPARGMEWLVAMRFVSGIGLGGLAPSAITLVGDYSPRRFRASSVIFTYCFFSLGFIAAGVASAWLIPAFGWRSMFVAGGVAPFAVLPFVLLYLENPLAFLASGREPGRAVAIARRIDPGIAATARMAAARPADRRFPVGSLFESGRAWPTIALWVVYALNLGQFYALQTWLPDILTELGRDSHVVVTATTLSTVGGIAISFVMGPAMDRLGAYVALAMLYLAGTACIVLLGTSLQGSAILLYLASFLAGCCVSGGQKSIIALSAILYPPDLRSTGIGWGLGIGRVGGILGPLFIAALLERGIGPDTSLCLLAIPMPLMAALVGALKLGKARGRTLSAAAE